MGGIWSSFDRAREVLDIHSTEQDMEYGITVGHSHCLGDELARIVVEFQPRILCDLVFRECRIA